MNMIRSLLIVVALLNAGAAQADTTMVILRHGEKPPAGLGQLNCKGLNRSLALAPVLLARYGVPTAIFAPNPADLKSDKGVQYAYVRPLATIEPTAIRAGLPVQIGFGMADIQQLGATVLGAAGGTYFIAWEHHWGEALARHLLAETGGDASVVPVWDDADFDSLYVIRVVPDAQGQPRARFSREAQNLNGVSGLCAEMHSY